MLLSFGFELPSERVPKVEVEHVAYRQRSHASRTRFLTFVGGLFMVSPVQILG